MYFVIILANFQFPYCPDLIERVTWASTESADLQKAPPLISPRIIFGKTAPLTSSEFGLTTKVGFSFIPQPRVEFSNSHPPGWAASVAYMNAVNNVVLRAAVKEAKQLDFDMDFDEADEYYDTTKVSSLLLLQLISTHFSTGSN